MEGYITRTLLVKNRVHSFKNNNGTVEDSIIIPIPVLRRLQLFIKNNERSGVFRFRDVI